MVIDASVVFKWFIEEPGTKAARKLILDHSLKAPTHLLAELMNALWVASAQGRFDPKKVAAALEKAERSIDLIPVELLADPAMEMALALKHPVYDCLYLAAATQTSSILITADERFHRVASASKWGTNLALLDLT